MNQDTKIIAEKAAKFINANNNGYPKLTVHKHSPWLTTTYYIPDAATCRFKQETDEQIIEIAKTMGWTPPKEKYSWD
jgi:hypothetical protein